MAKDAKKKVLDEALQNIEKDFGKGAVIRMWDNSSIWEVKTFHSGSYVLDIILWWGYPEGRVIELYGPEWSGKTTMALHAIASVQKRWEVAAFIDAEHAMDPIYAKKLWVDVDNLYLAQPNDGEQALSIAEELAKSGAVKLLVIDSVAALVPRAEVEWSMWDSHMWLQARMMSQWLRKLTSILAKTWTSCIFINQLRMKIGIVFGNPETTTGWNALKFYASQRLDIRRKDKITENGEEVGYYAKITTKKNKIFAPFKITMVPVKRNQWVDKSLDIIEAGMVLWLISRSWAFYSIKWQKDKVQGKEKLADKLKEDKKLRDDIEKQIQKSIIAIRKWEEVLNDEALEKVSKK